MIAIFFKNHKTDHEAEKLAAEGQAALNNRMVHMLRDQARIAWATPPAHLPFPGAVKKPFSIRKAIAPNY